MKDPYDDILNLPRPISKRPRMAPSERAAQFAPFAALTGHGAAIRETARLTDPKVELAQDRLAELDERLQSIQGHQAEHPEVTFTYFRRDGRKEGGSYQATTGRVKRLDGYERKVILLDGREIPIDVILGIEGDMFSNVEADDIVGGFEEREES